MGREPSRDLCRHSSSFAYHVTSLWRLPSCFAAMLFCDDTITRRRCGGKVEGQLMTSQFLICMSRDLSMEAVILFCCHVVLITRRHCGARSKITDLLYLYDCQLGLGLITLILTSVVNPDPNPKRHAGFR